MFKFKFVRLSLLLGLLALVSVLSGPAQAQSDMLADQQLNAPKVTPKPTKTKKNKSTSTSVPPTRIVVSTMTRVGTTNTPAIATTSPVTVNPLPTNTGTPSTATATSLFASSATPTALQAQTQAAQLTGTVQSSLLTTTALASRYSPTPTNIGAPTWTATLTPNPTERTATSAVLTTIATEGNETETILISDITPTFTQTVTPVVSPRAEQKSGKSQWLLISVGVLLLLFLLYWLYKEIRKK